MAETTNNGKNVGYFTRGGKYRQSAKMLLPYRRPSRVGHPADKSGLFSTCMFSWMTPLLWKLYKTKPTIEELWDTANLDKAETNSKRFKKLWDAEIKEKGTTEASIKRVIFKFIKMRLIMTCICITIVTLCQFVSNAIIVRRVLMYVSSETESSWKYALGIVLSLLLVELLRAFMFSLHFAINYRMGIRLRSGLLLTVFQKVMKLPPSKSVTVGEIVNICSNDGDRLFESAHIGCMMFTGPVMFIIGTIYCGFLIGPIGVAGCFLFIVIFPVQAFVMKKSNEIRQKAIRLTDKRVKYISEVLTSIKLIKMYSWEKSFLNVVEKVRISEKNAILFSSFLQSGVVAFAVSIPMIVTTIVLLGSVALGKDVTAVEAFTLMTLLNVMAFALKVTPLALRAIAEAFVSLNRFRNILIQEDFQDYIQPLPEDSENTIEMDKATFSWHTDPLYDFKKMENGKKPKSDMEEENAPLNDDVEKTSSNSETTTKVCLSEVSLKVRHGSLVGICGTVGSGKSSLLSSILSQLKLHEGSVKLKGNVAYCSQAAWIMNATVRENILFGRSYDEESYNKIVKDCCLLPDFVTLKSSDLTEVGERGINLSGGQKQRISLARALYRNSDVYLLDDPLSAVDAHVGKNLFENVVMKSLKNKTVLLVTHQLQYLESCDLVVFVNNGRLEEVGTHEELMESKKQYGSMFEIWKQRGNNDETYDEDDPTNKKSEIVKEIPDPIEDIEETSENCKNNEHLQESGKIIVKESTQQQNTSWETYKGYIIAGGGLLHFIVVLFSALLFTVAFNFNIAWLTFWMNQGSGLNSITLLVNNQSTFSVLNTNLTLHVNSTADSSTTTARPPLTVIPESILLNPKLNFYMLIFGLGILFMLVVVVVRTVLTVSFNVRAAQNLHYKLFRKVMKGTMEFFDTTPTGRILNRFQKDQDVVDTNLPFYHDIIILISFFLITNIVFITVVSPYILILVAILIPIFIIIIHVVLSAVREVRRLDNLTRSPWISHIVTSVSGVPTIRSYQRTKEFIEMFSTHLDTNTIPYFLVLCSMRWVITRMDFVTVTIAVVCSILMVVLKGTIPTAFAGMALTSALMMAGYFQFTVRNIFEFDSQSVAVDRILEYFYTIPEEQSTTKSKTKIPENWPKKALVEFQNFKMRYRENLQLALKGVTFKINHGENIGVVGRTGSGKSSLGSALFRLVEGCEGTILIDGIDIASIPLESFRPVLSIIPQDPVLFTGTIRYNLDPFNNYTDERLWEALDDTHLKETVEQLPDQLGTMLENNGGNLSMGERQLICLARVVLRNSKIIFLDEATASIDAETDVFVQETIMNNFTESSLIIIAHRLHTVLNCDKILVMDDGEVAEFDTPSNLMKDPNSHFSKLLAASKHSE